VRRLIALAAATLVGCAAARPHVEPPPPVPLAERPFVHADPALAAEVLGEGWWRSFGDPALDAVVEQAVLENLNLKQAAARVAEVKAFWVETGAAKLPEVTFGMRGERSFTPGGVTGGTLSSRYSAALGFSYEVDLWGRVANLTDAAVQDVRAAEADRHRAFQVLVTDVVRTYVSLRLARETVDLHERTADNDRRRLGLIENRSRRGLAPAVDVYQARQRVAQAESRVHAARQSLEQTRHRLNVFLGGYPAHVEGERREPGPLAVPVPVPPGLPLKLVARRPDLEAARARYWAAGARVGVAAADRYPRLALTGSWGRQSDPWSSFTGSGGGTIGALTELIRGENTFWTLVGNLTAPIFTAGARKAAVTRADAQQEQARLVYGQALLEALREVEDVLVEERSQRARYDALERSVSLARKALEVSEARYGRGLEDLTRTLSARNTLFAAELEQLDTRRTLLLNRAALYLSLGGDWGLEDLLTPAAAGMKEKP
jgi:multidrug efflux system outer membrane protein